MPRFDLSCLLTPRSVVVVGASSKPGSLGASVISNLDRLAFPGEPHLVNPNKSKISDRPCLPSVDALPDGVDAAVLAIPQAAVLPALRGLAAKKVGAAVVFSAGFAEGGEAGLTAQAELAKLASAHGIVVEGPNCLGLVNYVAGVALTFVETPVAALGSRPGVGIVSQSGAMAAVLGVMISSRGLGLSYSISTGNEAVTGVEDYIEHLLDEPNTHVIGMIVEHFRQPQRFLALARKARARGKPIVILHPGRSGAAHASAATHTGAMAGDYELMRVMVERAGVILAESLEELGDLLELLIRCPQPRAQGPAVMAESGAFKALTLDLAERIDLSLPGISDGEAPGLRAAIPPFVPVSNPLDMTAQALVDPDLYRRVLQQLLADDRFGSIVIAIIQTDPATSNLKFPPIIAALRELVLHKPVLFAGLDQGAVVPAEYIEQLRALGVPYFPSPERSFRAIARLDEWAARSYDVAAAVTVHLHSPEPGIQTEHRSKQLLAPIGIPFPRGRLVQSIEQAQRVAEELGFPVVLKAQSAHLPHKTEAGGVILNLQNATQVESGWRQLHQNIAMHRPDLELDGVLVEVMGHHGTELILGARRDPEWGPVLLAGFGGIQAELLRDACLLPPDLPLNQLIEALHGLRCGALLRDFRGSPPLDVEAVGNVLMGLSAALQSSPSISEIDLNPVVVYERGHGALALDALLVAGPTPSIH